jgi:hypothetical protein
VERLWRHLGILSDAYVHYTPEFTIGLDWRNADAGDEEVEVRLNLFTKDRAQIEREMVSLAGVHTATLDIFNDCYDKRLRVDNKWAALRDELEVRGHLLENLHSVSHKSVPKKNGRTP